eukprot:2979831-Prymnesium_polylepis.1
MPRVGFSCGSGAGEMSSRRRRIISGGSLLAGDAAPRRGCCAMHKASKVVRVDATLSANPCVARA